MRALSSFAVIAIVGIAAAPKVQKVYRGPDSDFIDRYQEVVRDSAEWRSVWAMSGGRPVAGKSARVPNINFTRKMVIVSTGMGPTTAPDSVVIQPDPKGAKGVFTVVTYRSCKPGAPKTTPIDIIAVPADPGSVLFRDKVVKDHTCPASPPPAK